MRTGDALTSTKIAGLLAVIAIALSACGGASDDETADTSAANDPSAAYGAQVASYDVAAAGPQRFLVGLIGTDGGTIVGGEVTLDFTYFGADPGEASPTEEPAIDDVTASFVPVAGGTAPPAGEGPRLRTGDEGVGVYEATEVRFDEPGFWGVTVHATINDVDVEFDAAFEVSAEHQIVKAGDPDPRTVNLLPGAPGAPATAVDSRAEDDGTVPDPELHRLTVADAIATGRPTLIVVSTPVFCVSRFCGPITDSVQALADEFGDQANFVHIEVWKDFEGNVLNASAAEWIYPEEGVGAAEPWVFLIDGSGTVVQRWDNVANQAAVGAAVAELVG